MSAFLAQVGDISLSSGLVIYGPMGIMLAWFMLRFESMIKEVRTLAHRIDGMTRAMLVDVMSRDSSGPHAIETARDMLARIEARDGK